MFIKPIDGASFCGLSSTVSYDEHGVHSHYGMWLEKFQYGLVSPSCVSQFSQIHEMGHTIGCFHDFESGGFILGPTNYHYGYRLCGDGGFRTIMAYR